MESGYGFAGDELRAHDRDDDLGGRAARGMADEIGERILILGDLQSPTSEFLRFRKTLTTSPGFEVALRRRVERLRHFRHAAFASTPAVEYLGQDRRLALVSPYTAGRRLSDVLAHAQDPVLAASLVHQLAPALDALTDYGEGVGHGALTASRIVNAPDGQLVMVEHVLGSAVERLHLTAAAIWRDLGIPMPGPDTGYPQADGLTDCFQLAVIALSMLAGRALRADEQSDLARVLDHALPFPDRESDEQVPGLRQWLEQALQLEGGFLSSRDATAALRTVAVPDPADAARRWRALRERPEPPVAALAPAASALEPSDFPSEVADTGEDDSAAPPLVLPFLQEAGSQTPPPRHSSRYLRLALVAVALCAVLEAIAIARLLAGRGNIPPPATVAQINLVTNDPGAPVKVDGRLAGVTPLNLSIDSQVRSVSVGSSLALPTKPETVVGSTGPGLDPRDPGPDRSAADARTASLAPPPQRSGGIRVSSPIELELFAGDRRLGSTATGIVPVPAGRYEVDLVNSVVGFRTRQVIDVRAGQVAAVAVAPPNGRININAVPWAEVLVDGKSVGETPIGNLSLPLGEHEIVFRHPQLGEARQTAVVRLDAVTRVSANLQR